MPAVSTVVMLAILLGLGVWQLQRRAWKADILARIMAAEASPGVELAGDNPEAFTKVSVTGRLRSDLSVLYGAEVREQGGEAVLGARLLTPLVRAGGSPVLLDRGWVDVRRPRPPGPEAPLLRVDGYVRAADSPHWFSAADDVAGRRFYTLDPAAIGAAIGLPAVAPFVLVALGPPGTPDPVRSLPRPPNDHFQYALTWFGFAVTLVIIFALYARKVLRS